ncbi:MAG TPA: fluoride efflux transporter CrcB [Pedococcus sp.]|jgi:CrcB protein
MRAGDRGLLLAIAAGGALGSLGRYAVARALPDQPGAFPTGTFLVNVSGSLAMGVLFVWVLALHRPHPWLRPFLGVGVLGGWTTFSTYALESRALVVSGHGPTALLYAAGSLLLGLAAVGAGVSLGERAFGRRR